MRSRRCRRFKKSTAAGTRFFSSRSRRAIRRGAIRSSVSQPRLIFESRGRTIRITENGAVREFETARDPLHELETLMQRYKLVPSPAVAESRFVGGAVGYLGYDMVRFFEPSVTPPPPDDLGLPESLFFITETQLIFDHRTRRLRIVANALVEGDVDAAYARAVKQIEAIVAKLAQSANLPTLPITPAAGSPRARVQHDARGIHEEV